MLKCGFKRPFINRVRVCTQCGAVYQTSEVVLSWGVKQKKKDKDNA